jgi:hypothetical protein
VQDVFFGGARGVGKTDALLGDFLSQALRYKSAARGIIFRKTYDELSEVISRSKQIYSQLGWKYSKQSHTWESPNGATLLLRYLESDDDASRYQGHSYTYMGFDEAGSWATSKAIDELWATLRSAHGVPCLRRLTGNPGGPGHIWIKKRYIDVSPPWKPFKWAPVASRPDLSIESVFIPGRLEDNKILMAQDPGYEARLAAVGTEDLFRAWRYGDWSIVAGQFFDIWEPAKHVISDWQPEQWHQTWISGDWGFNDLSVIHWHAMDENRVVRTYRELAMNHTTPIDLANAIAAVNRGDKPKFFFLSPDAFDERHAARSIAEEIGAVLRTYDLPFPSRADRSREGGWMLMYQMLRSGAWLIVDRCNNLTEAMPILQRDTKNMEDVAPSPFDHAPDSARYGLKSFIRTAYKPMDLMVIDKVEQQIKKLGISEPVDINQRIRIYEREEGKLKKRQHGFGRVRRLRYAG